MDGLTLINKSLFLNGATEEEDGVSKETMAGLESLW
jgi:hypothetical protein